MAGVIDNDKGWKQLMSLVRSMRGGGSYVKMGLVGEEATKVEHTEATKSGDQPSPLTNVDLAVIHEFGTDHAPERSFIRRSFDENHDDYEHRMVEMLPAVVDGKVSARLLLDRIGYIMEWKARRLILEGEVTPPLAASTVAAKIRKGKWNHGSSAGNAPVPLMDTGRMAAAITHEVVEQDTGAGGPEGEQRGTATIAGEEP